MAPVMGRYLLRENGLQGRRARSGIESRLLQREARSQHSDARRFGFRKHQR
jgi:hypothetical protein